MNWSNCGQYLQNEWKNVSGDNMILIVSIQHQVHWDKLIWSFFLITSFRSSHFSAGFIISWISSHSNTSSLLINKIIYACVFFKYQILSQFFAGTCIFSYDQWSTSNLPLLCNWTFNSHFWSWCDVLNAPRFTTEGWINISSLLLKYFLKNNKDLDAVVSEI